MSTLEEFISIIRANPETPIPIQYIHNTDISITTSSTSSNSNNIDDTKIISTTITPKRAANGKGTIGVGISNRVESVDQVCILYLLLPYITRIQ